MKGWTPLRANRDFRLLWTGQTLSTLGGQISAVAFPLLVLATTGSPAKAGLVGLVANAPFVLLQLPAGAYVDRWNRRAVMLCADAGRAAALGSLDDAIALNQARSYGTSLAGQPLGAPAASMMTRCLKSLRPSRLYWKNREGSHSSPKKVDADARKRAFAEAVFRVIEMTGSCRRAGGTRRPRFSGSPKDCSDRF